MNILPALISLKADWIWVMTSSMFAALLAWSGILGYTSNHHWISWMIFVLTLCWAFVRSWNREHRKVALLMREFVLPEMHRVRYEASGTALVFSSSDAEIEFYVKHLNAASRGLDRNLIQEAICIQKANKSIIDG